MRVNQGVNEFPKKCNFLARKYNSKNEEKQQPKQNKNFEFRTIHKQNRGYFRPITTRSARGPKNSIPNSFTQKLRIVLNF